VVNILNLIPVKFNAFLTSPCIIQLLNGKINSNKEKINLKGDKKDKEENNDN